MVQKTTQVEGLWERLVEAFNEVEIAKIAKTMGLSYQSVYKWSRDESPGIQTLVKIATKTNTSIHWLLTGEGQMKVDLYSEEEKEKLRRLEDLRTAMNDPSDPEYVLPIELPARVASIIGKRAKEEGRAPEDVALLLMLETLVHRGDLPEHLEGLQLVYFGNGLPTSISVPLAGRIHAEGVDLLPFRGNESVEIAEELVKVRGDLRVFKVSGDSMSQYGFQDGDLVVGNAPTELRSGQLVLTGAAGVHAALKYVLTRGKRTFLLPLNLYDQSAEPLKDLKSVLCVVEGLQSRFRVRQAAPDSAHEHRV